MAAVRPAQPEPTMTVSRTESDIGSIFLFDSTLSDSIHGAPAKVRDDSIRGFRGWLLDAGARDPGQQVWVEDWQRRP
jgi:hypothetical protein